MRISLVRFAYENRLCLLGGSEHLVAPVLASSCTRRWTARLRLTSPIVHAMQINVLLLSHS